MSDFDFHARYALLTYAQSNGLDPNDIVRHIANLGGECIVARENHQTGGIHYHVFCDFGRKIRKRRNDVFNVGSFHPNIQPTQKNPRAGWDYATKDGDIVAGGLEEPHETRIERDDDKWITISNITDETIFWSTCKELVPKTLLTNFPSLQKYAAWKFQLPSLEYTTPNGITFNDPEIQDLDEWATRNMRFNISGTSTMCNTPKLGARRAENPELMCAQKIETDRSHYVFTEDQEWAKLFGPGVWDHTYTGADYSAAQTLLDLSMQNMQYSTTYAGV